MSNIFFNYSLLITHGSPLLLLNKPNVKLIPYESVHNSGCYIVSIDFLQILHRFPFSCFRFPFFYPPIVTSFRLSPNRVTDASLKRQGR